MTDVTNPVNKFKKSTFMPPGIQNATLVTFSKLVEKDLNKTIKCANRKNNCNISVLEIIKREHQHPYKISRQRWRDCYTEH